MRRNLVLAVVMLLSPAAATAQPARPGAGDLPVACDAFQHQPLGAWTVLRDTTVATDNATLELPAGRTFATGDTFEDVDVTGLLDRYCGTRK